MTEEELGFLQQILDDPENETVRLVYADWLEEHGDNRGELIRLRCDLASLPAKDGRVKKLQKREKELVAHYDEEWLVLLERADWKRRYLALEPKARHKARWALAKQEQISSALQSFESEIGCKLPRSYKAYAHIFGPGEMAKYFRINVPCVSKSLHANYDLSHSHGTFRESYEEDRTPANAWLDQAIFFATTIGGESIIWDTASVSDLLEHEYRVCWLSRSERIYRSADSFPAFIDEVCLKVLAEEGEPTPQEFLPYGR